jgi:hypothetical protein
VLSILFSQSSGLAAQKLLSFYRRSLADVRALSSLAFAGFSNGNWKLPEVLAICK